jgi:zinc protease
MIRRPLPTGLYVFLSLSICLVGQGALDRTRQPPIGKPPELRVPAWTKSTLANGAELVVSEKHDLPLVSFSITFLGGADQFEAAGRRGLTGLAAAMLQEGTKTRDGDALSNALQLLGTSIRAGVNSESGSISFVSTSDKFPATLDILADVMLNPTFPTEALERLRAQRLVALTQAKAQPGAIASRVFARVVYGDAHPFGQLPTETSITAITRSDIVAFHRAYFTPGRALVTVVGDVRHDSVRRVIERSLSGWARGGERPVVSYPAVPAPRPTTIYLVDKAGSAQSVFVIGLPGPPRNTPDYYAIEVMNTMLGGMFQSRLNANIREQKGYSYGVSSSFGFGKGPRPFRTGGDVVGDKTDAALTEFMKELRGILGDRPVTDEELRTAKESLTQALPELFASAAGINGVIARLWIEGLPDDYYQQYTRRIESVTAADVVSVAKKYIDLAHLSIVIVGDRQSVEQPLRSLGVAPIVAADIDGNVLVDGQ